MKYLKYVLFILIVLIPIKVNAGYSLDCGSNYYSPKSNAYCTIWGNGTSKLTGTLSYETSYFSYGGPVTKNGYTSIGNNTSLAFTSSTTSYGQIASLSFQINSSVPSGSYSVYINNVATYDSSNNRVNYDSLHGVIKIANNTTTTTKASSVSDSKTFTITFDSNGGTIANQTLSCTSTNGSCKINLSSLNTPVKNGATFTGWSSAKNCLSTSTSSYTATKDATLYACYKTNESQTTTTTTVTDTTLFLKSLVIENQTLEFSKFKYDYTLKVLYDVSSINIKAEAASSDITVDVKTEPYSLNVGDNTVVITLTKGSLKTEYTIKVTRLKEGEKLETLSSDATLSSVSIGNYTVAFSPTTYDYNLTVDYNTTALTVNAITSDKNAKYSVAGNVDIMDGSIITISVTAPDGTINVYRFNIKVQTIYEQYRIYIIAGGIVLLFLIIYFIVKIKKDKQNKKPVAPKKNVTVKNQSKTPEKIETL